MYWGKEDRICISHSAHSSMPPPLSDANWTYACLSTLMIMLLYFRARFYTTCLILMRLHILAWGYNLSSSAQSRLSLFGQFFNLFIFVVILVSQSTLCPPPPLLHVPPMRHWIIFSMRITLLFHYRPRETRNHCVTVKYWSRRNMQC